MTQRPPMPAYQPGSGRPQNSPNASGGFIPPAQSGHPGAHMPPRMSPPAPATPPAQVPVAHEHVSDFGEAKAFQPGSAAAVLAQTLVAKQAAEAPLSEASADAQKADDSKKPFLFEFEFPIDNGGKEPIKSVTFKRPRWSEFQKAMRHRLVLSGEMTDNDALISAVTGLPLELLPEIDALDGARLLMDVQAFFLKGRTDKPSET